MTLSPRAYEGKLQEYRRLSVTFDREHEELVGLRARVAAAVACLPRRPDAALAILRGEEAG